MSEQNENLRKLLQSNNDENFKQGLILINSMKLTADERSALLDFSDRELSFVLSNSNLSNANFSNSVIKGRLNNCDLSKANFQGAWIAAKDFSSCILHEANCKGAIVTDETLMESIEDLPKDIQAQIHAFYPVQKLHKGVSMVEEAINEMGGSWEPSYVEEFLRSPTGVYHHKLSAYMNSMQDATSISTLQKRYNSRRLEQCVGELPKILQDNDVYMSGQFDDEGGYYFGNLHCGPSWPSKNKWSSTEECLLVVTYDYFYLNFDWEQLKDESETDLYEFIVWLYDNDSFGLPFSFINNEFQDDIKPLSEWSDEEKEAFEKSFVDNWEIGHNDSLSDLYTIVSDAHPNYIGGEWVWTSWSRLKNST